MLKERERERERERESPVHQHSDEPEKSNKKKSHSNICTTRLRGYNFPLSSRINFMFCYLKTSRTLRFHSDLLGDLKATTEMEERFMYGTAWTSI
jgi:hypothetical protein